MKDFFKILWPSQNIWNLSLPKKLNMNSTTYVSLLSRFQWTSTSSAIFVCQTIWKYSTRKTWKCKFLHLLNFPFMCWQKLKKLAGKTWIHIGPHFLCWISGVVPFNMWLISSWEENKCCHKLSKCTKWHLPVSLKIVEVVILSENDRHFEWKWLSFCQLLSL